MPSETAAAALHVHPTLAAVEARWRALWPRAAAYAFQSFDWFAAWHVHIGQRGGWQPCIVELRAEDGATLMLLPLGVRRDGLLRVLSFLGGDLTDYHAPLIDRGFAQRLSAAPEDVRQLWLRVLAMVPRVDTVRMRRMPASLPGGIANPMTVLRGTTPTESAHAARLPADFADFRKTRAATLFADTRRQLRRMAEQGQVRIETRVPPADVEAVMSVLAAQKSRRWRDTGSPDAFATPGPLEFYRALTLQPMQGAEAVVSALYLDGRAIATHWGLRTPQRFYWLLPAYDAEWARFSPGRVLMEAVIQQCIEDGLERFDLTVGDEPYKQQWADEHMPLHALLQPQSLRGYLAAQADRLRQRAREWPALRRAVRAIRSRLRPSG